MAESDEVYLKPTEKTVLKGYRQCREYVRENFDEFKWAFSNLSGEQKYSVWAILTFSGRCWQLLNLDQGTEEATALQQEWHQENRDWFNGKYRSARLVALVDTIHKFKIEQANLYEMLEAVEQWLTDREFKSSQDYTRFARKIGGPVIRSIVHVLECGPGIQPQDLATGANLIGQSIAIAHMLSRIPHNLKRGRIFLPLDQLRQHECRISDLSLGRGGEGFSSLIGGLANQAEIDLMAGAGILPDLSYDGQRVMKSILSLNLRILHIIKSEPNAVLERPVDLSAGEQFKFQLKHILGLEGGKEFSHLGAAHH